MFNYKEYHKNYYQKHKEKILQNKNGNIIWVDEYGIKSKGRQKIYCKCGCFVDLAGALKKNRTHPTHWLVRCKKCGRYVSPLYAEIR